MIQLLSKARVLCKREVENEWRAMKMLLASLDNFNRREECFSLLRSDMTAIFKIATDVARFR